MSVLVVFAASAAACERDNPGFKLKDTSAEIGDTGPISTTSVSSPTVTSDSDSTTSPTTTTTSSTTESLTVTSDSTTTTLDPTTGIDPTETTGGNVNVVFPSSCEGKEIEAPFEPALVDTFFVNEAPSGNGCSLSSQDNTLCRNDEFGQAPSYELFNQEDPQDPFKDLISLFAVRYAAPQPKYVDLPQELAQFEGLPVKQESWVGARARVHVFRPEMAGEWTAMVLQVVKFAAGDVWEEGAGLEYTPCNDPASSFRCRRCDAGVKECKDDWSNPLKLPYADPIAAVTEFSLKEPPGVDGKDVVFDIPVAAVRESMNEGDGWLLKEGMMVVPKPEVPLKVLAVKTVQADEKPALSVLYCNPVIMP